MGFSLPLRTRERAPRGRAPRDIACTRPLLLGVVSFNEHQLSYIASSCLHTNKSAKSQKNRGPPAGLVVGRRRGTAATRGPALPPQKRDPPRMKGGEGPAPRSRGTGPLLVDGRWVGWVVDKRAAGRKRERGGGRRGGGGTRPPLSPPPPPPSPCSPFERRLLLPRAWARLELDLGHVDLGLGLDDAVVIEGGRIARGGEREEGRAAGVRKRRGEEGGKMEREARLSLSRPRPMPPRSGRAPMQGRQMGSRGVRVR